jgi:hypothetical protein
MDTDIGGVSNAKASVMTPTPATGCLTTDRNHFLHWIWSYDAVAGADRVDPPGYKPTHTGRIVALKDVTKVADDLVWLEHRLAAHLLTEKELRESKETYGLAGAPDAPTPWPEIPAVLATKRQGPRDPAK